MVRDFFYKLLRREISSFVRKSVTVAPFLGPPQSIRPLPFNLISSWRRSRRHTRIGTMKSAPQCGCSKSRSTTVGNYTLLCICKSSKQTDNLQGGMWQAGDTADQYGTGGQKAECGRNRPSGRK